MDYQEHLTSTTHTFEGIVASVDVWRDLRDKIALAMEGFGKEAASPQELVDLRASLLAEQTFFKDLHRSADVYRHQLEGFKAYYRVETPSAFAVQPKTQKTGWFGGRREEPPAPVAVAPVVEQTAYEGQRAFAEAKRRAEEYDALIASLRGEVETAVGDTEEAAYVLRSLVVGINAELRAKPSRKLESRRFYLEDVVAACSERVVSLGLNARVLGSLASAEFVENPFAAEDAYA